MVHPRLEYRLVLVLVGALYFSPLTAQEIGEVAIEEWDVPWASSRPRDPYMGPGGLVWFVGQQSDYAASFDPENELFERFDLPDGSGPHNLVVGSDGTVWYTGNRQANVGRLNPDNGEVDVIPMPDPDARDPHTLVFDEAGILWFTVQGGNFVGKLDPASGDVTLIPSKTTRSRPYGIVVNSKGVPWVALFGTNKLARVDPNSLEITEIELPRSSARPRRLQTTSDDRVWYVDYAGGYLGVFDPGGGSFEEWLMPGGSGARPYGMAVDAVDRLWFVETGPQPNRFVGFEPATESFYPPVEIPSGGGAVRHMYYDDELGQVWFGTDRNTIGRALLPFETVTIESRGESGSPSGTLDVGRPYPNPTSGLLRIPVNVGRVEALAITVFDVSGRAVYFDPSGSASGETSISIDATSLAKGTYFVRIEAESAGRTKSFTVVE